jgi:uncharacterized membrane protein YhiD involved in acid resistance
VTRVPAGTVLTAVLSATRALAQVGVPGTLSGEPSPPAREAALGGAALYGWQEALIALPVAALLGAMLAFRPVRRGTPPRNPAVIQTQVVLAIVGAVVMLIVGASLARAFGIVGAASLVRYRAKIGDPKDAAVMLAALSVGLATGVGIYAVAVLATLFALAVLWLLESLEPEGKKAFLLKVTTPDPARLRPQVEALLRGKRVAFELRGSEAKEVSYEVQLPNRVRTDRLANAIQALEPKGETGVNWEEKEK